MIVLIADKFAKSGIADLTASGCEVIFEPSIDADSLATEIEQHQPNILIVRSTKVSAAAISAANQLNLIVRAGAGYDTIDVGEASRRGIYVANCPGKNSVAVAELVWGLILSCDRRIPDQTHDLRRNKWDKKNYSKARGLKGLTLGIIGTGKIGMEVARRGMAFDMEVVAWSRSLTPEKAESLGVGYCATLADLANQSDVVSVNVAANADTNGMIDETFITNMKDDAFLINTSRGSVVDAAALANGICDKNIRAGLDVFANEPGSGDNKFTDTIVELPGVYGTHHVGASTDQSQTAIAAEAVRVIIKFLKHGRVDNCVNLATQTPASWLLTVRHLNLPGVLAHVFQIVGDAKINVEEMQNVIYDGAKAACAKIQLGDQLSAEHIQEIQSNQNILGLEMTRLSQSNG